MILLIILNYRIKANFQLILRPTKSVSMLDTGASRLTAVSILYVLFIILNL